MRRSDANLFSVSGPSSNHQCGEPLPGPPFTKTVRLISAGLCLVALGLSAWQLAAPGQAGTVFDLYPPRRFLVLLGGAYALLWGTYFALGRATARRKLANCVMATASVVFCWGLMELPAFLGIVDYRLLLFPGRGASITRIKPWNDPRNRFDRELMYTRRPGEKIVAETTGDLVYWLGISTAQRYHVDAQYDRNGFRNDHAIESAPVAVLGDSFLEAGLVPHTQMLSTRLSQLLNVEVANLALGGYGPQQELVVLRRYALPLRPRLVLWFFFEGNDLLDVPRYEQFAGDVDAHLNELQSFANRSFANQAWQAFVNAAAPRSAHDSTEAHRRSCRLRGGQLGDADTIYFGYDAAPLSPTELASLAVAESQLLDAQRMTAANGATLMLVYIPIKFRVYEDLCDPPDDGYARSWKLNDLPNRLEQWSAAHQVPFLDLTAPLREHAAHGELVYFPDDGHWNATGNAVAAAAIAESVAKHATVSELQ